MLNDAKMDELAQDEEMAYFRADICCYSHLTCKSSQRGSPEVRSHGTSPRRPGTEGAWSVEDLSYRAVSWGYTAPIAPSTAMMAPSM